VPIRRGGAARKGSDMATETYPVSAQGRLDPPLSRWLWLVKWILLIPHYLVLGVLAIVFLVLTVVAFWAVLFTGRYPRGLFDVNLGILRWGWRVSYYGYGALGTDRYPPFTLDDVEDYPARLDVAYPERLSRGLVLVKWWLLALPHYLVLAFLLGGATWAVRRGSDVWTFEIADNGLIGVLVLVAAVVLLFRGRYPQGLHDLIVGLDRWVLRVVAYAALMTDRYPPFRLDLGGNDPAPMPAGPAPPDVEGGAAVAPTGHRRPPTSWTAGRIAALVVGALLTLTSLGLLPTGAALMWADASQRDSDGYLQTDARSFSTPTAALLAEPFEVELGTGTETAWVQRTLGTVRLSAEAGSAEPLFVGLGPTQDVNAYLDGVAYDRVREARIGSGVRYSRGGGELAPAAAPESQPFWVAAATGPDPDLTWTVQEGSWTLVVMRADGQPEVAADVSVGATVPALPWAAAALLGIGVVLLVGGVVLLVLAAATGRRPAGPPPVLPGPRNWTPSPDPQPSPTRQSTP
jgi:hypothetical protein